MSTEDAILALWGYVLFETEPGINAIVDHLYVNILDGFWDPQRDLINRRYQDFYLPFAEISCPEFEIENIYDAAEVLGYLRTWSAVSKYHKLHGEDPVELIEDELIAALPEEKFMQNSGLYARMAYLSLQILTALRSRLILVKDETTPQILRLL